MKKFAVAVANLMDNDLRITVVDAIRWQEAIKAVTANWDWEDVKDDELEEWKQYASNGDMLIDVKELIL